MVARLSYQRIAARRSAKEFSFAVLFPLSIQGNAAAGTSAIAAETAKPFRKLWRSIIRLRVTSH